MAGHSKRRKLNDCDWVDVVDLRRRREAFLSSLSRGISPPPCTRDAPTANPSGPSRVTGWSGTGQTPRLVPSPFRLTTVRDLPASDNVDTVSLHDILGNPLIKEAWIFNFCFDVDWTMEHFDSDVRDSVQVRIIHGSWRREDSNKMAIDAACNRWPNVTAATAYLPDQFGTHHSKMFVLFCHDDTAEVIIHTANMIAKDWTNMTQAVWRSGPLHQQVRPDDSAPAPLGSGPRFKQDLLAYVKAYNKPCKELHSRLSAYSFDTVRGALVASVPSKIKLKTGTPNASDTVWGWPQLRAVLSCVHGSQEHKATTHPHLVAQVSSIASLNKGWLNNLVDATKSGSLTPSFSIIYPTATNVASSLDGYAAGGSIHTKAQSAAHLRQIASLRPHLCQWTAGKESRFRSGRHQAAPHIKTYVQYSAKPTDQELSQGRNGSVGIDWALLTSANLSMQAWGSLPRSGKDDSYVHVQSYEIGVLVWPSLFDIDTATDTASQDQQKAQRNQSRMVPVFGKDLPDEPLQRPDGGSGVVVGFRMPYDLPLVAYSVDELPWSLHSTYTEPDNLGRTWPPAGW